MSCPTENTLFDFVHGRMSQGEVLTFEGHLDGCAVCQKLLATAVRDLDGSMAPPKASWRLAPGTRVGRYEVLSLVGVGAMGVVYSAFDPELGRKVALKLIRVAPDAKAEAAEELRRRLIREARAMARLSSPAVIAVYDAGTFAEQVFVAMEFVEGGTLTEWLKASPRQFKDVLDRFLAAGDGLVAAHEAGLIHRDFKPDNVLCGCDGRVRITDFGLVRAALSDGGQAASGAIESAPMLAGLSTLGTRTGSVLGTPAYMAPEQMDGQHASARTDQFAFCVALYQGLYGERPFAGNTLAELRAAIGRGEVRAPTARRVPGWLRRIVVRGLCLRAEDRFVSMSALLAALRRPLTRRFGPWPAAAAGALVVGTAIVLLGANAGRRQPAAPAPAVATSSAAAAKAPAVPVLIDATTACAELARTGGRRQHQSTAELETELLRVSHAPPSAGLMVERLMRVTWANYPAEARECAYKLSLVNRILDPPSRFWRTQTVEELFVLLGRASLVAPWNAVPRALLIARFRQRLASFPSPQRSDAEFYQRQHLGLFLYCALGAADRARLEVPAAAPELQCEYHFGGGLVAAGP